MIILLENLPPAKNLLKIENTWDVQSNVCVKVITNTFMNIDMKNYKQTLNRGVGIIGMIFLLTLTLASCSKKNDDVVNTGPSALFSVINLSPGSPALDFYLDQNKTNGTGFGFADGYSYLQTTTGKHAAIFYQAGTSTKVKTDTVTLVANKAYTLFLTGLPSAPQTVFLRDTLTQPASGKAGIRFANFSPDAPAVDFAIAGGAVLATNKSFKDYSTFIPVDGNAKITLEIRKAGTTTVLASLSNITPQTGYLYTIWLQGLSTTTDQTKVSANYVLNAYF